MRRLSWLTLFLIAGLALIRAQAHPDLVLVNGRIFTGVTSQPWAEALAITGDRILAIGTSAEIRSRAVASTRLIEVGRRANADNSNHLDRCARRPSAARTC
jgi:hypothetical protein